MRNRGGPPSRTMRRNNPRAYRPRAAKTLTQKRRGTAVRTWRRLPNPSRRQPCFSPAGNTVPATGLAQPRERPRITRTTKRGPKVVASKARASGWPSPPLRPPAHSGATPLWPCRSWRGCPRLALAASPNSRTCWRTVVALRSRPPAKNRLPALRAQARARTIPTLHNANPVACGLLKWGKGGVTISVHW